MSQWSSIYESRNQGMFGKFELPILGTPGTMGLEVLVSITRGNIFISDITRVPLNLVYGYCPAGHQPEAKIQYSCTKNKQGRKGLPYWHVLLIIREKYGCCYTRIGRIQFGPRWYVWVTFGTSLTNFDCKQANATTIAWGEHSKEGSGVRMHKDLGQLIKWGI